jgi:hypothetical protein
MARLFGNASVKQGQRSYNRLKLGVPAVLVLAHGRVNCLLDDVSVSGAKVRTETPIAQGQSAELLFDRHRVFCAVSWSRAGQAGLSFVDPLAQSDMQRLLWIAENREQWEAQRETIGARAWSSTTSQR